MCLGVFLFVKGVCKDQTNCSIIRPAPRTPRFSLITRVPVRDSFSVPHEGVRLDQSVSERRGCAALQIPGREEKMKSRSSPVQFHISTFLSLFFRE